MKCIAALVNGKGQDGRLTSEFMAEKLVAGGDLSSVLTSRFLLDLLQIV